MSFVKKVQVASRSNCELTRTKSARAPRQENGRNKARLMRIWIDLDNTPHAPFFKPVIRELEQRGYEVVLTARDAFQVCELASASGLSYYQVRRHYGRHRLVATCGV